MAEFIAGQIFTVHINRTATHGGTGNNIFAGGLFHKSGRCNHRNITLLNFLLADNAEHATKMVDMAVGK